MKSGTNTYDVIMNDGAILAGQFGVPVEMESKFKLELLFILMKRSELPEGTTILFLSTYMWMGLSRNELSAPT
ncbi:unnamed protein product [Camellia sinensis]